MNADNTPKQGRLLAALMTAQTLKEAAKAANIPYETARRMLREPDFQSALADLRRDAAEVAVVEALHLAQRARATLLAVMDDESAPAHARIRAAEVALEYARNTNDQFDLHTRLQAIEARLANKETA